MKNKGNDDIETKQKKKQKLINDPTKETYEGENNKQNSIA